MATDTWDRFWASKDDLDAVYPASPKIVGAILDLVDPVGSRILEIGAGTGRDTAALASIGAHAVALDPSHESLDLVRRAGPGLAGRGIVGGDGFHLPFADGAFDVVFHQGVLEHFGNPAPFLAENFRVTRPGGWVVVDVPQTYHPWTVLKRAAIRVDRWFAGWETDFTVAGLERLVRGAGYEIVDAYGDWMVPSLGYRLVREVGKRAGVTLPLEPKGPEPLRRARAAVRDRLLETRGALYFTRGIGVIGRRPENPPDAA